MFPAIVDRADISEEHLQNRPISAYIVVMFRILSRAGDYSNFSRVEPRSFLHSSYVLILLVKDSSHLEFVDPRNQFHRIIPSNL